MRIRFLAAAAALAVAVTALLALGTPAYAVGTLVHVQPDQVVHVIGHKCELMGSDQFGNQAVNCADFAYFGHPDGTFYDVWAHNQVFCMNAADQVVQCAGIHETVGIHGTGGTIPAPSSGICGVRFGHSPCPAGRVENVSHPHVVSSVVPNEYWSASTNVSVVLPGSGKTVSGPNAATPHYTLITDASQ